MKLNIKDKELTLKYSFRSLLIYERLAGHTFQPTGLNDVVIYFFSCVLAADKAMDITFDDFLDWLDENPQVLDEFSQWLTAEFTRQKEMKDNGAEDDELKKKKGTRKSSRKG